MSADTQAKVILSEVDPQDWLHYLDNGGTLSEAINMDTHQLEVIYTLAFEMYENHNYQDATRLFQLLCACDHFDPRFVLGLGACRQAQKDFTLAGETYSLAALVHPKDPRFPFHAAECHLALNNLYAAGSGFEMSVQRATNQPQYQQLSNKASQHIAHIQSQLAQKSTQPEETSNARR